MQLCIEYRYSQITNQIFVQLFTKRSNFSVMDVSGLKLIQYLNRVYKMSIAAATHDQCLLQNDMNSCGKHFSIVCHTR